MLVPLVIGLIVSSGLVIGGAVGAWWRLPRPVTGVLLAFASGTLIAALAFELFPEAVRLTGLRHAGYALVAGAVAFVAVNTWLDRRCAPVAAGGEKDEPRRVVGEASRGVGFALLASVVLDGVPENLALGISLVDGLSWTLIVAIFASNFPEAMVGAIAMRESGRSGPFALAIWIVAAALLTFAVIGGQLLAGAFLEVRGALLAVAGGAVIASLADTLMPEAFARGRPLNALATVAGFLVSFALAH